jgi:hypothetical protein
MQIMNKTERIIGLVLNTLLLLMVLNSTYFFLAIAKVSVLQWIVFNACAPSSLACIAGFVLFWKDKNKMWLAVATIPIFFFGTMGLFIFPWSGNNLIAQMSHIVMTLNMLWGLWIILKNNDYVALGKGLLLSTALFIPFISFTQAYCRIHADEVMKVLGI